MQKWALIVLSGTILLLSFPWKKSVVKQCAMMEIAQGRTRMLLEWLNALPDQQALDAING